MAEDPQQHDTQRTNWQQHDARQLGREGTMAVVRELLVQRFKIAPRPEDIPPDAPLFAVGVGLSSIDGMEFLLELEKTFGTEIKNVEWWVYDSPTLANVADVLVELAVKRDEGLGVRA